MLGLDYYSSDEDEGRPAQDVKESRSTINNDTTLGSSTNSYSVEEFKAQIE